MTKNLEATSQEFFEKEIEAWEVFEEFSTLSSELQTFIASNKSLTLRLISQASWGSSEEFPAVLEELWSTDYDVWLERVIRAPSDMEVVPKSLIDERFVLDSFKPFLEEDEDDFFSKKVFFESWFLAVSETVVLSSATFLTDMLSLLEENESNHPDKPSPFLFWMIFGADPAPFRDEQLCCRYLEAFSRQVSHLTECLVTFFTVRGGHFDYTWNAVAYPQMFDSLIRSASYSDSSAIQERLAELRDAISKNFLMMEDLRDYRMDRQWHQGLYCVSFGATNQTMSEGEDDLDLEHSLRARVRAGVTATRGMENADEVSGAAHWEAVFEELINEPKKKTLSSSQQAKKLVIGPEEFEAKIVAARKSVIAKNKSVYFGSITDEQLKLVARHSEDPEILAMIFRSKSQDVRKALASNGKPCAYATSLSLLKDKIVEVKEAVLTHAWLDVEDYEVLCEKQGARTSKNRLWRAFTSDVYSFSDFQISHLVENPNVATDFFQDINVEAIANAMVKDIWGYRQMSASERAQEKTEKVSYVKKNYQTEARVTYQPQALSESQREELSVIEEQLRQLNGHASGSKLANDPQGTDPTKLSGSARVGVSRKKDEALASAEDLTAEEFDYLIFQSRNDKARVKAIANPEMPYELFDRVLAEYPEDAPTSNYFWVRYLEDPQFLGKPELQRVKKLLANSEVPESFIVATFQRFRDGEEDRAWRKWRTTLIAMANHPNTPVDILKRLLDRNKKELNDAIKDHPRMQGLEKKEVKRVGRKVVRQYDSDQANNHACAVSARAFCVELRHSNEYFEVQKVLTDSVYIDSYVEQHVIDSGASSFIDFLQRAEPDLQSLVNRLEGVTECTLAPFFSTKERIELRLVGIDLSADSLDWPAMSLNAGETFLKEGSMQIRYPLSKDISVILDIITR